MEDNFKPKDLGTKLKDYDGDPDGLADGGRPGFAGGGIKFLKEMINKKFGKDTMKTADEVKVTDEMLFEKIKEDSWKSYKITKMSLLSFIKEWSLK
jgi:hypothetical protein